MRVAVLRLRGPRLARRVVVDGRASPSSVKGETAPATSVDEVLEAQTKSDHRALSQPRRRRRRRRVHQQDGLAVAAAAAAASTATGTAAMENGGDGVRLSTDGACLPQPLPPSIDITAPPPLSDSATSTLVPVLAAARQQQQQFKEAVVDFGANRRLEPTTSVNVFAPHVSKPGHMQDTVTNEKPKGKGRSRGMFELTQRSLAIVAWFGQRGVSTTPRTHGTLTLHSVRVSSGMTEEVSVFFCALHSFEDSSHTRDDNEVYVDVSRLREITIGHTHNEAARGTYPLTLNGHSEPKVVDGHNGDKWQVWKTATESAIVGELHVPLNKQNEIDRDADVAVLVVMLPLEMSRESTTESYSDDDDGDNGSGRMRQPRPRVFQRLFPHSLKKSESHKFLLAGENELDGWDNKGIVVVGFAHDAPALEPYAITMAQTETRSKLRAATVVARDSRIKAAEAIEEDSDKKTQLLAEAHNLSVLIEQIDSGLQLYGPVNRHDDPHMVGTDVALRTALRKIFNNYETVVASVAGRYDKRRVDSLLTRLESKLCFKANTTPGMSGGGVYRMFRKGREVAFVLIGLQVLYSKDEKQNVAHCIDTCGLRSYAAELATRLSDSSDD